MKSILNLLLLFVSLQAAAQHKFEVFFDFNKDIPSHESGIHLQNWIAANNNVIIQRIYGFCDSVDRNDYNKELASRRIHSVIKILEQHKLAVSPNVELNPFGEDFEQSRIQAENRKVAIFYDFPKPKTEVTSSLTDQVKEAKPGDLIRLSNMKFYNNSAVMVPESKPILEDLLCILEDNPKLKIEIQGHICCQLERDINGTSTARARAVYVFLIRNGIDRKRLTYKGYGITKPIHPIPEQNAEQEDENRRVEIRIVQN